MRLIPAVFGLLLLLPFQSAAQVPADSLVTGELVQYELSSAFEDLPGESQATFDALTTTGVVLSSVDDYETQGSVELPRELIDEFEVARGTKNVGLPVAIGMAGVGCAIGFSFANNTGDQSGGLGACFGGILAGGSVGFVLGTFIKGPNWQQVEFD